MPKLPRNKFQCAAGLNHPDARSARQLAGLDAPSR